MKPVFMKSKPWWMRLPIWIFGGALLMGILFFFGSLIIQNGHHIISASNFVTSHFLAVAIFRFGLMIGFVYFYPTLMVKFCKKYPDITDDMLAKAIKRRWPIIMFVLYELLIVHNLLSYPINYLIQSWS